MALEVLGIDHIYIAVSDLEVSTTYYDKVMKVLGFRKGTDQIGEQPHVHYFNRTLQYTLRPASAARPIYDQDEPGLHHLCFQVQDMRSVDEAARLFQQLGIEISKPSLRPAYGADYYAAYFKDPDGIELEIVNRTRLRNTIHENWDKLKEFENPLRKAGLV